MPNLNVVVPGFIETALNEVATARGTSIESIVNAALGQYFQTTRHRLYQISTAAALVEGVYEGAVSSRILLAHGNFGLGTFEHLDGEMVVLDGNIYQVHGNGSVELRPDDFPVPFAVVSYFEEETTFAANEVGSLSELEQACDTHRESDNLFYALRADGVFEQMHTRAMSATAEGTHLVQAAESQPEFRFNNIEGTLVCIWSPGYSRAFSVPGYHFHFMSKDRTKGGHVLNCSAQTLRIRIQTLCEFDMRLPGEGSFLKADLTRDTAADLKKAE